LVALRFLAYEGQPETLQDIFNELRLKWQSPLALSLWINLDPALLDVNQATVFADLLKLATSVTREPEPGQWRQLVFDPLARVPVKDYNANPAPQREEGSDNPSYPGPKRIEFGDLTVRAIFELLGGEGGTISNVFRTLSDWQQNGFVRDVRLALRKNDADDALLLDWLSDGERMLLGRVALVYLLRDQRDALLILDEPETHFNDAWKRRLVDMFDDALRDFHHQIVVSTHSSIVLSDVFNTEITVLNTDETNYDPVSGTIGTLPSEIMRNIFSADTPIGDRAREFLDPVLALVEYPDLANALWRELDANPNPEVGTWIGPDHPFGQIVRIFNERSQQGSLPSRTPEQWLRQFRGSHQRTRQDQIPATLANVIY
jgi:hypothetical protein